MEKKMLSLGVRVPVMKQEKSTRPTGFDEQFYETLTMNSPIF